MDAVNEWATEQADYWREVATGATDNGTYTEPRSCAYCDFATIDRDEYWSHRLDHEQAKP